MTTAPSRAIMLFGTEQAVAPPKTLRAGPLSVELENGNLRYIRYRGVEVLRAISFLARDRNWATYVPGIENLQIGQGPDSFTVSYNATCRDSSQELRYRAAITGRADGTLRFEADGRALTEFVANRVGFVVLHPLEGVAGEPVEVTHTDGSVEQARFPRLISPAQPFFDIRALTLKGHGFDLQKDTQIVTATAPPDMVTLLAKGEVDAIIAWQPITDSVVLRGQGVYLVKQIDLWRKATGRATGFPVHVCYLVHNDFLAKHPGIARDLNDAQKDAVDVWYKRPERAMEIVAEVTKLPMDVIKVAHKETVQMLHGLPDEQVETLIAQLKINKEFGFLKSDIWDNPDRIRREFFLRA